MIRIDPRHFHPATVETLLGGPANAKQKLGLLPELTAHEMCAEIALEDLKAAQRTSLLKKHGLE